MPAARQHAAAALLIVSAAAVAAPSAAAADAALLRVQQPHARGAAPTGRPPPPPLPGGPPAAAAGGRNATATPTLPAPTAEPEEPEGCAAQCHGPRRFAHIRRCLRCRGGDRMLLLGVIGIALVFFCGGVAAARWCLYGGQKPGSPITIYVGVPVVDPEGSPSDTPQKQPPCRAGDAASASPGSHRSAASAARGGACAGPRCVVKVAGGLLFMLCVSVPTMLMWVFLTAAQQACSVPVRAADALLDAVRGGARRRVLLTLYLRLAAPVMTPLAMLAAVFGQGAACWGAAGLYGCGDADGWYATRSVSRRKCVKRNLKQAAKSLAKAGIEPVWRARGRWGVGREHLRVLAAHCNRHGGADRATTPCMMPIPTSWVALGELFLIACLPLDIQEFRRADGELVAFNTRLVVGRCAFNPNYACVPEHSRSGIYWEAAKDLLTYSTQRGAEVFNMMPSMASAKQTLGLHTLPLRSLLLCWKCRCCPVPLPPAAAVAAQLRVSHMSGAFPGEIARGIVDVEPYMRASRHGSVQSVGSARFGTPGAVASPGKSKKLSRSQRKQLARAAAESAAAAAAASPAPPATAASAAAATALPPSRAPTPPDIRIPEGGGIMALGEGAPPKKLSRSQRKKLREQQQQQAPAPPLPPAAD